MGSARAIEGLPRRRRVERRAAVLALLVLGVLLVPRAVLRGEVFFERDVQLVWHPQTEAFVHAIASGSWPLWDPHVAFGHPMLANPNTQALYPPTWLNLLVPAPRYYTLYALGHLVLAGVGLRLLALHLGLSSRAALVAAGVFMASGPVVSLVNVWHHLAGAAWLPWVVWAGDRALTRPTSRRAALWGLFVAVQALAGSPDMSLLTVLVEVAHVAWRMKAPGWRTRAGAVLLAAAFAAGLSAGQWLPTLELLRGSSRAALAVGERGGWAVAPLGLAQVLSPVAWPELPLGDDVRIRLFDGGHPFLRSLYLGLPAFLLAGAALAGRSRRAILLAALALVALAYAMGPALPVYEAATAIVRPLRSLRYPGKAMVLVAFAWALLCGIGIDAGARRWRAALLAFALVVAGALAFAGLGGWLRPDLARQLLSAPAGMPDDLLRSALAPGVLKLGVAGLLGLVAVVLTARGAPVALVGLLAVGDLCASHHDLNRTTSASFYRFRPPMLDVVRRDEALPRVFVYRYLMTPGPVHPALGDRNPYAVARVPEGMDFDAARALSVRLYMLPSLAASFGTYGSFEPDLLGLYPARLREWVEAWQAREGTPGQLRMLQLGGVQHVVALHARGYEDLEPAGTFTSLLREEIRVFRVPDPLPRVYATTGVRVARGEPARRLLLDPGFDLRREVVLEEGEPRPAGEPASCRLAAYASDHLEAEVDLPASGHVVVLDTFDPGWRATVDGRPAPVLAANTVFRAVPVPAGRHRVRLVYRPPSVLAGLGVSALALVALLVVAATRREDVTPG
jgi:hypothetical protein